MTAFIDSNDASVITFLAEQFCGLCFCVLHFLCYRQLLAYSVTCNVQYVVLLLFYVFVHLPRVGCGQTRETLHVEISSYGRISTFTS